MIALSQQGNIEAFREFNSKHYYEYKHDDTTLKFDEGFGYYVVSFEWMKAWRNFIGKTRYDPPGMITNSYLKQKIQKQKSRYNYPEDDKELGLSDKSDYYMLSCKFWKFFFDLYGADQIIVMKFKNKKV